MEKRKSEFTFETDSGLVIDVYRVQAEDAAYLVDLFEHLSTNSRYMRFNQYLAIVDPEIVQREAEHIALVDAASGLGVLAFADLPDQPHAPVAVARYVRTGAPQQAEVSVSVRDDMQHQGIGGQMLLFLSQEARAAGIRTLIGTFQTGNRRIWALLAESPYQSTTVIDGFQTTVTIDLGSTKVTPDKNHVTQLEG
ncbi:MAG: hypothetical protein KDI07_10025 [Anaerolineae bacterium]|nr:hypothetical protein [Anaerolineae bacterium]MCB9130383.1 hypothetical protein [Anaerolineales bacterium]MCB0229649.1 hypothetical protein [Anaerolineae bacterium]MCB0234329.1 hypothetical protein [Anaerolineae bacterium]MCB0239563.1 hypothetical protein [Anaerolineae bacterium]